mmetsp:Transcript_47006/g.100601  ORF Transcript_47006/g.100601 Transcript_47006/m.100601 type:complete len:244 (+) Transcript_47006:873-1604(+)
MRKPPSKKAPASSEPSGENFREKQEAPMPPTFICGRSEGKSMVCRRANLLLVGSVPSATWPKRSQFFRSLEDGDVGSSSGSAIVAPRLARAPSAPARRTTIVFLSTAWPAAFRRALAASLEFFRASSLRASISAMSLFFLMPKMAKTSLASLLRLSFASCCFFFSSLSASSSSSWSHFGCSVMNSETLMVILTKIRKSTFPVFSPALSNASNVSNHFRVGILLSLPRIRWKAFWVSGLVKRPS